MTCPVCGCTKLWGPAEIAEAGRLGIPVFECAERQRQRKAALRAGA